MPRSLSQFVLKIHGRCDLACDHCYVYESADQSWREKAFAMSLATLRVAARRIAEHARTHRLPTVHVVLHGGEPLLVGVDAMRDLLAELRATIDPVSTLDLRIQTNGVRLSQAWCELFVEYGVMVGVSLDGDREANDRHRRFRHGAGSYDEVLRALELLRRPAYRESFAGILCTIDIANDPVGVYRALVAQGPPRIDLLLPHATWETPPVRPAGEAAPYARWLGAVYQQWTADGRPVPIRIFDSLLSVAAGGPSGTESIGLDAADLVVIETDGAYEQADSTKVAYEGAPFTGLNVFDDPVDAVVAHPDIASRQAGLSALCQTCQRCPVVRECGGGLYAHRYGPGGYDHPSVYCADLKELVVSIKASAGGPGPAAAPGTRHEVDLFDLVDDLGGGAGSAAAISYLADTQLSFTRSLVVAAAEAQAGPVAASWPVLTWLDQVAPAAVRVVLSHPYVRVWAVTVLGLPSPLPADLAYLSWLTAAAAIRSGLDVDLEVALRAGELHLPTLGTVAVGANTSSARLSTGADGFTVVADGRSWHLPRGSAGAGPTWWRPTRAIGPADLGLTIEDGDPYRDCHQYPVAGPLPPDAAEKWRGVVEQAWSMARDEAPEQMPSLRGVLRALAPLRPDETGRMRSATARQAFGSVGVAYTADPAALAAMLVHEVQHNKLGALLDLCDLFDRGTSATVRVGWRPDPRPLEGALQGTYAHLALADIWRVRAAAAPRHRDAAAPRQGEAVKVFQLYRGWTLDALAALPASGALTPAGVRFVARMAQTVSGWSG